MHAQAESSQAAIIVLHKVKCCKPKMKRVREDEVDKHMTSADATVDKTPGHHKFIPQL